MSLFHPMLAALKKTRIRNLIFFFILLLAIFFYLTNPFVRFSAIADPYTVVTLEDGLFMIEPSEGLLLRDNRYARTFALMKSGWHIVTGKISGGPKGPKSNEDDIINAIHQLRFSPDWPYLISGDHFSAFYPRSLGLFYHSLLDPRTARSETDWHNRQLIYLKSTAYALDVFSKSDRLATTIVPVGVRSVALINVFAPPSDTLFSLLYALTVLQDPATFTVRYPYDPPPDSYGAHAQLKTPRAAKILLDANRDALRQHWIQYRELVYDETSGLIRTNVRLSGVKDMAKRESSFYDNVIFWKTAQLAKELTIAPEITDGFLDDLKNRIIEAFWDGESGIFLEDLSTRSRDGSLYSSDWILAYQAGFLRPADSAERQYLMKSVAYIQHHGIDEPFGLKYHTDPRPWQLHLIVRWTTPSYGSTAIWSNWGMEYIKLLTHLARETGDLRYLQHAGTQLEKYTYNITRYRGYPEVYNQHGDFFRQGLYKSVRQTGWVVSYEQAKAMYEDSLQQKY